MKVRTLSTGVRRHLWIGLCAVLLLSACDTVETPTGNDLTTNHPPELVGTNGDQVATVGVPFSYNVLQSGSIFVDPDGDSMDYGIVFSPRDIGLVANGPIISGTPIRPATITVTVTADDRRGGIVTDHFNISVTQNGVPVLASPNSAQAAVVGFSFTYDATKGGTAFNDPDGDNLTYQVVFSPDANGLTANNGVITGAPGAPGITWVAITASDPSGNPVNDAFYIACFATVATPSLPGTPFAYADADINLPAHYRANAVDSEDNTPGNNQTTNAGATLGRVLFYDTRLSRNDREACASCHKQENAFADPVVKSMGFAGGLTGRNSPSLSNARYYGRARAFWDERAASIEAQALMPIQDPVEMGQNLDDVIRKLEVTPFYPPLFQAAFGTPEITSQRISRAIAQFVRSMVSFQSKYDSAFNANGNPNFAAVFTAQEEQGRQLFDNLGCDRCHSTNAHVSDNIHNTGLDATTTDDGAGNARFKSPSLRNIEVTGPYMHDGRFATLEEVVEFYNSGVQAHPNLDNRMETNGQPTRLNLTQQEKDALVAFLKTLTDNVFITDQQYSDPFQ